MPKNLISKALKAVRTSGVSTASLVKTFEGKPCLHTQFGGSAYIIDGSVVPVCGQERFVKTNQNLQLQLETWTDYKTYFDSHNRLLALEFFHPSYPLSRREHTKRVTGLYREMLRIEQKYPFIEPKLSKEWDTKLISEYIRRNN